MKKMIKERITSEFSVENFDVSIDDRNIVTLTGNADNWTNLVKIGQMVASVDGIHDVVNKMTAKDTDAKTKDYSQYIKKGNEIGIVRTADVVIIGGGVSGCGIARELSKYPLDIVVVEMTDDLATGASKANNGNIHPGNAVKPGTLKAKLNIKGNKMYTKWSEDLGFHLVRCGSMRVATEAAHEEMLEYELDIALKNGVEGAVRLTAEEAIELQPNLKKQCINVTGALWFPTMGLVEPYKVCVALAENAAENGVEFVFNCGVGDITTDDNGVTGIVTEKGIFNAKYVINCAGLYADEISKMAGDECYTIHPRMGTIAILDKNKPPLYSTMMSLMGMSDPKKNAQSKGGGMCLTPENHILMGPSATEIQDKSDVSSEAADFQYDFGRNFNPDASERDVIRIFAGNRPASYKEDFVIEMSPKTHGFINVGAIQSPGLASAPAIAEMVENILLEDLEKLGTPIIQKPNFNPIRKAPIDFDILSREEQEKLVEEKPEYGHVVCRCETVTEGEIIAAIHSKVPPNSIDGLKRRVRTSMGRCQGGFCQPRVIEIMARELGKDPSEINLNGEQSNVLIKNSRGKNLREVQV